MVKILQSHSSLRVFTLHLLHHFSYPRHDVNAVINTNRQEENWNTIHCSIKGQSENASRSIRCSNGEDCQANHISGISNGPEFDVQKNGEKDQSQ